MLSGFEGWEVLGCEFQEEICFEKVNLAHIPLLNCFFLSFEKVDQKIDHHICLCAASSSPPVHRHFPLLNYSSENSCSPSFVGLGNFFTSSVDVKLFRVVFFKKARRRTTGLDGVEKCNSAWFKNLLIFPSNTIVYIPWSQTKQI